VPTASRSERPDLPARAGRTALPRRFDHYRQLIERTALEIRSPNRPPRSSTVIGAMVTVETKPGFLADSDRRRHQRLWRAVETAVLGTFRAGDIKLSDGRSVLVLLSSADAGDTAAVVDRLRNRFRAQLRPGLVVESPDRYLAVDVVEPPQQAHKPCTPRDNADSTSHRVYEIGAPYHRKGRQWGVLARGLRRTMDIFVACVGIIIAAPLLLFIGVLIRLSSPGPLLFRQQRVGRDGQMFTMLKFRTMHMGADDEPHRTYMKEYVRGSMRTPQSEAEASPIFKLTNDNRIFRFGSFLRRWSLDELPQLLNVLSGDMSLVGPRPSVYYELEDYQPWHRERLKVRPGLTGMWQIYGRGRTTFDEMVRLDIRYIRRQSIALDLKLLLLTGPAVFGKAGAA
jgi:lipopolysaccharide/colanic/teichoic acid biosynthesis glycosyltransferase